MILGKSFLKYKGGEGGFKLTLPPPGKTTLKKPSLIRVNAFRSGIFPIKSTQGKGLKILTPKQMLQRLPIALAEVKAGNTSENLLNEIRQIMYSLHWAKEITEKVYDN